MLDEILMTRDELVQLFTVEYRRWPVKNRLEEIRKPHGHGGRAKKDALMGKVERACAARIEAIKGVEFVRSGQAAANHRRLR